MTRIPPFQLSEHQVMSTRTWTTGPLNKEPLNHQTSLRLFGWGVFFLVVLSVVVVLRMPDIEGVRLLIRSTARTSMVFFVLAYTAQSLVVVWPSNGSRWLRMHRRQWGWLLVISHAIHAVAIGVLAVSAPALFDQLSPMANRITGGLAYAFIVVMGVTSFDQSAAWIGRKWWGHLHTWGSHYLWLSFLVAFGKRVPANSVYLLAVGVLLFAFFLRWYAHALKRAGAQNTGGT